MGDVAATGINVRAKRGTNQRRITDGAGFPLRSRLHLVMAARFDTKAVAERAPAGPPTGTLLTFVSRNGAAATADRRPSVAPSRTSADADRRPSKCLAELTTDPGSGSACGWLRRKKTPADGGRPMRIAAARQAKYCPPFAVIVEPVMKPASSEARKTTQRAISSGSPSRPTGICGMIRSASTFSSIALTISVAM